MKIFYFQKCVERFNVKMSIIVRLGVDLEYWVLLVNKVRPTKLESKAVMSTAYIKIESQTEIDTDLTTCNCFRTNEEKMGRKTEESGRTSISL